MLNVWMLGRVQLLQHATRVLVFVSNNSSCALQMLDSVKCNDAAFVAAHAVRKTQSLALLRGAPSPSSVALPLALWLQQLQPTLSRNP
jgi:hypothetical protein